MYPEHEFLNARTEAPYFQLIRDMTRWPSPPSLYTELDEHAGELQRRLGAQVLRQILPYRVRPPRTVAAHDEFVVAVLGAGRADKAFDMLPEIVAATRVLDPSVQFRIQRPGARARLDRYVSQLEQEKAVAMLPAALDDDAYEAELARAHIVLLAYDPQRYARRGSGVLVDALVAGRPVVCVAGTALAGALGHGNGLAAEGAGGLARAVAEARGRYPDLLAGAARARDATMKAMAEGPLISALKTGSPPWA
jgi:glycosyltransferase involved in cell wall biosynthesis